MLGVNEMGDFLNNISMQLLQRSLDAVWFKQKIISNNIANADTSGYKSKSVEFENILNNISNDKYTNSASIKEKIKNIKAKVVENNTSSTNENGNNVSLDEENIELARIQIQYEYLIGSLTSEINRLKYAINSGK